MLSKDILLMIILFSFSFADNKDYKDYLKYMVLFQKVVKNVIDKSTTYEYINEYFSMNHIRTDQMKERNSRPYMSYIFDRRKNSIIIIDHTRGIYAEKTSQTLEQIYGYSIEELADIADFISEGQEIEEEGYEEMEINGKIVMVKKTVMAGMASSVVNLSHLFDKYQANLVFTIFCGNVQGKNKKEDSDKKQNKKKKRKKSNDPHIAVKIHFGTDFASATITTKTIKIQDYNHDYFQVPKRIQESQHVRDFLKYPAKW